MSASIAFVLLFAAVIVLALFAVRKGAGARTATGADAAEAVRRLEADRDSARAEAERYRTEAEMERTARVRHETERAAAERSVAALDGRLGDKQAELQETIGALSLAREELAAARTQIERDRLAADERLAETKSARVELANEFKMLANGILEEKSRRFTEQNAENLGVLLTPLRERLGEFQARVESLKEEGIAGRSELKSHIENLRNMNDKLSLDANNLVKALKGSAKTQGDWGEVLLIGILEDAGLRAGKEYRVQETFANEQGRHVRPDIILDLPGGKHLVIDSKVSLNSYAEYCACDDDESRKGFLDRHTRSVRDHVDGLSKKAYQRLHQLQSLDFVIMFVPIEPAYLLALAHDGGLWQRAWTKDVLLVSPSTLYPILRTIQYAWQQERQSRNVEEIVRQGGALYDKVALFANSFEDLGKKLGSAQGSYEKALGQLASGRGNLLAQVEKMRQLGLRKKRAMPLSLVGADAEEGNEGELTEFPRPLDGRTEAADEAG